VKDVLIKAAVMVGGTGTLRDKSFQVPLSPEELGVGDFPDTGLVIPIEMPAYFFHLPDEEKIDAVKSGIAGYHAMVEREVENIENSQI
jgi:hypothetical protein